MATPYSQDLRDKVLAACDRGMATKEVAEAFGVCRSWIRRVKQRRREHGETTPRRQGSPGVRKIDREELARLVAERPDATGPELRDMLSVECSESAVYAALKELDLHTEAGLSPIYSPYEWIKKRVWAQDDLSPFIRSSHRYRCTAL